jgi:hypothetical protein
MRFINGVLGAGVLGLWGCCPPGDVVVLRMTVLPEFSTWARVGSMVRRVV